MMKQPGSKHLILMLCMCLPVLLQAQHFRYQCLTDTVKQNGFYSIPITPEMSAHMQTDFRDVRIWDEKKMQVPYIFRSLKPKWQNSLFKPFPIVENILDDSDQSIIDIKKNVTYAITNLTLVIKNASVSRYASLSGSNDGKKWFIISEHILINENYEMLTDSSIQSVSFPPSGYLYFRLKIDNNKSDPLNIVSIGYSPDIEYKSINPYNANPQPKIIQTDSSNEISYVKVIQQQPFHVDQISLEIGGPKYFSRNISVLLPAKSAGRKPDYFNNIASFSISPTTGFNTPVPVFKADFFYIIIENGDNPPLAIKNVNTAQEIHRIIAWLQTGKQYTIMMDANDAVAPHYDLQQFQDSIQTAIPTLSIGKIEPVTTKNTPDNRDPFPQKWLWLIMAGAVTLLALLTWRLTGEMRKKER